jgi:formate C-acetyltransferase
VPQRLSDATRDLAARALSGEHGRGMREAGFALDEAEVADLGPNMRYAMACRLVAERAPLRILPGERIVGSATLLEAARHQAPLTGLSSTSHTTLGFHRVLQVGYRGLREQVEERIARGDLDGRGLDLLHAMRLCLEAAATWHRRHLELLDELVTTSTGEEQAGYRQVREALERVPEEPPGTFREAVQSLWFAYAFQRLMGNWSGLGRIDEMLGPYLKQDLAEGRITLDEAHEFIAHLWIKGCEWIGAIDIPSGDAQHYQNIVLGGVDAQGQDVTNEVTYLVLDVVEELHISDFPIAVRVNARTPDRLLRRIAEVQRHGGGIVSIYNEDVVIEGLVKFGYALEEARTFANDGCWEVLIPGRTTFGYMPFDALGLLHEVLGLQDTSQPPPDFASFEDLYAAYRARLAAHVDWHNEVADTWSDNGHPAPLVSLLVEDCIERGRGYYDRGSRYYALAPHAGGLANVANSLLAIKRLVYDGVDRQECLSSYIPREALVDRQECLSSETPTPREPLEDRHSCLSALPEFVAVLRSDWEDHEPLRRYIRSRIPSYGNDDEEADAMLRRVFDDYSELVGRVRERDGVKRPCGISTFGREIEWAAPRGARKASPDGHRLGAVLATNFSPSPGTDVEGPTAAVKSYCKMDFTRTPNGATLELKLDPGSTRGEEGLEALVGLLRTFIELRGFYLQIDVVDSAMLLDAQQHPDRYPNLAVRVSGWSARFATLSKEWQDMIIARTQQRM